MNLYMLVMIGQGDTHVKLVTENIWKWISDGDMSHRPPDKFGWDDPTTPVSVRQAAGLAYVTTGSLENDKALWAEGTEVPFDEYGGSDVVGEAKAWAKKNGHTIVSTWYGYTY